MALFPKNDDYLCLCTCFHLAAVMLILTAFVGFAGLREFPDWQQSSVTHVDQWCTSDALSGLYNPLELCSLSITHSKASTHIQHGIFPPKQLFLNHTFLTPPIPLKKRAVWEFTSIYRSAGFSELCRGACTHSEVCRRALSLFTRAKIAYDVMLLCSHIFMSVANNKCSKQGQVQKANNCIIIIIIY